MKGGKFFQKLLIIAICLVLLDRGLGTVLRHFYFKIRNGEQGRTTYAIDSCVSDLVILGSSRAAHHYVSPVFSQILNTDCYNAGKDKQRLRYCLAMLDMLYSRYTPEQVILDLNPTAFETNENGLDELSVLLPYYHGHPEIQAIIDQRNKFEWLKTYSDLYCFNSLPLKILFNNLSSERSAGEKNGYVPLVIHKELIPGVPDRFLNSLQIDSSVVDCFRSIIQLTKTHHTRLFVVVSPIYFKLPKRLKTMELAKSICRKEGISFLDFSQSPEFLTHGREMFLDTSHLNDSSAVIFSTLLADTLKKMR